MRRVCWLMLASAGLLTVAGCGGDPIIREVRELRLVGQPDSARALALSALSERADRRELWLEFARASAEACRFSRNVDDPQMMESCVQAALVCAAVQQQRRPWGREWRDAGRLVFAEVGRQLHRVMSDLSTQTQTAGMLGDMRRQYPDGVQKYGAMARIEEQIQQFRDDARRLLTQAVIWRRLLDLLPELNPGASAVYGTDLEERQNLWIEALQLEPAYSAPVQQRARERVDAAVARLREDLDDLGHFLLRSVTENGVLP